ncbi:homeodomain-interacting protein kinase 1-like [Synchiropus picturatus]
MNTTCSMSPCSKVGRMIFSSSSAYMVEKVLGTGAFGEVSQCLNLTTFKRVALKQTRRSTYNERAEREVQILKTLQQSNSHRYNIVRWHEAFVWEGCYCLEFEKLDVNLLEYLRRSKSGSLKLQEIRPILQQLATALQFLQSLKIVHADLKPENIMMVDKMCKPPRVKLIDFGLAIPISEVHAGKKIQTLWYRAPEILQGAAFNETIDIWSLGCIAVELFLGKRLFAASDEHDMVNQISHILKQHSWISSKQSQQRVPSMARLESHSINDLNDLLLRVPRNHHAGDEMWAELKDRMRFVELIEKMLEIEPSHRITPTEILQDPFLTMSHLVFPFDHTAYYRACIEQMDFSKTQQKDNKLG